MKYSKNSTKRLVRLMVTSQLSLIRRMLRARIGNPSIPLCSSSVSGVVVGSGEGDGSKVCVGDDSVLLV
jgi:hypothetical protein